MSYFSSRMLRYATNASSSNQYADYGEVVAVITDKLININMGGSGYILEAVTVSNGYIPKIGDWVTVNWNNGNPVANGSGIGGGLQQPNTPVIISTSDLANNTINSEHIQANSIETTHLQAGSVQADQISANSIYSYHLTTNSVGTSQLSANSITSDKIQANAINAGMIQAGAVNATAISANSITSVAIQANAIQVQHISANAVQTNQISANSINSSKIQANAINATHISANSVTATAISANSITSVKISANAVQAQHISANSVQTQHISANSITAGMIQANQIGANHITANAIGANQITANAITSVAISANSVQSQHISANSIQAQHIQAGAVNATSISANSIYGYHITASQISANHISAQSITSQAISANAIQGQHISANSISGNHIVAGTIQTQHISANSINAGLITANAINANHITANAITSVKISANSIQTQHISSNTIQGNQIQANQISGNHITANAINATHITANAITSQAISANSIQTQHISANSITGDKIQANQISGNHIVAGTINTDHLAVGTIQQGLLGQYYTYTANATNKFGTFKGSQIDQTINFSWGTGSPSLAGQADLFAVRWQGYISAPETGTYQFVSTADDGTKLVINNTTVINNWINNGGTPVTGNIAMTQGNYYPIVFEYFENTGTATVKLEWIKPSLAREVIPAKYLSQGNTVIDGAQITTGTITASSMQVGTITAQSGILADASITTATIKDGNITSAKIGNAEIKSVNIASGNITNIHIANATIDYTKINSVDATTITVGKLNGQIISGGTITGDLISGSTITGDKIKANTIDSLQIKSGAITTTELSAGAITADKVQAGAITSDAIRAGSITAEHISTVGLDAKIMSVYNSETGETLIGGGYLRVDGLDAGVVQSDNLLQNGLFLASSFDYGFKRTNPSGEALLGNTQTGIGSHQVWKIDLVSGTVVKKIDIPAKKPVDVAIHPSGNFAYITVQGDNTMVQLDLVQDVLTTDTKTMGVGPSRAKFVGEILEDHKHVFVLNNDPDDINVPDSLIVIDTPPESVNGELYVHHKIALGNSPYDFVVDANMITYITMASEGHVVVVDSSGHDSALWKVKGVIPITAYGTDNLHGGLDAMFGLQEVTGGDASGQYNDNSMSDSAMSGMGGMAHSDSGYGSSDGSLRQYTPQGIEQSTDADTLYVIDSANGELVVVDKYGNAPYNALTGHDSSSISPIGDGMESSGGGPKTTYVRYRIPLGDTPNFIKLINGKLFISMTGSNDIVVIDEQQILNEINADRTYYGKPLGEDIYENWNPFMPMRTVATFTTRVINNVGSKPSYMNVVGGNLYVTLGGQNQVIKINPTTEKVSMTINVGTNPKGFDFTPDGRYMYVANFGGSGDLSFIYPMGSYVGDPFMGLEGGILYQGADGWTPDRSDWTYDSSGNIQSKSTVEFHINEPLLNEGGYAKLTAYGTDYQYSQLEQDITNVTNYSNGNNVIDTVAERLIPDFSGNIWTPRAGEWLNSPAPHNIMICTQVSGSEIRTTAPSNKYTIYYGSYSRLVFSANAIPSGGWIEADYRAKNNIYFKTHNSSMLVAIDNGSSPNFNVSYQVDEFVPKFVAIDNQVTSPFTPTADGISEQYNGLEYSVITNRASGMTVTTSVAPTSGSASLITNNFEPDELDGDTTLSPVPSSNGSITMPSGNQWVKIDLGAVYMVGKVSVAHSYGLDRTYHKTKTEVSEDGVSWYTVYDSAVSGEYNEKPFYHAMHNHTHYAHFFTFGARPVRYVRDWANGWVSGDGLTSGSTSNWTEIKAYGDWQVEKGYSYPTNSPKAGQQIATNGYGFVSTDISKAYVAMNIQIEFTSWWYMTYIVGPQFGKIKIEMPTLMNSGHYLNQEAPFINNVAHRHIMSFPPSQNIMADMMNNIEAGKHRVVIRQESGKVTLDRLRFEDFQYYNRSSLLIPTTTSATLFTRYKVISEQAKWYQGQGKQSTEGAYDTVRVNPDSGQPDYSVPIKYRVRLLAELNANGSIEERGTAYITSAIFETGKLSSHWRRSESSDMMPAHMIEHWNGSQPHNTGIQHDHLANGAVRSEKILPNAIYDYHISNYARISEFKLDLNHPTHPHGYYTVSAGAGPLGTDLYIWNDTLDFLNSMTGWAGISGNYGTGSTVARGDHKHDNLYLTLTGGTLTNTLIAKGINTSLESHFANGVYADPANGTAYGLKVSQGIATDKLNVNGSVTITGNITVTGTVDGVDVSSLNTNVTNHIGSGGSAHAIAISGGANGFIDGTNYGKLLRVQDNAINQTTADGRYIQINGNTSSLNISGGGQLLTLRAGGTNDHAYIGIFARTGSAIRTGYFGVASNASTTITLANEISGNINLTTLGTGMVQINGYKVWHSGNMGSNSGLDSDKVDGYHASNASGNIPISNGTVNAGLNADKVDGYDFNQSVKTTDSPTFTNVYATGLDSFKGTGSLSNKIITVDTQQIAQSPISPFLWHDIFAFNRLGTPAFEVSTDGTTFASGTLDSNLFSQKEAQSLLVLSSATQKAVRWTWNVGMAWSSINWILLASTYVASGPNVNLLVESSADNIAWTTRHSSTSTLGAQPYWLYVNSISGDTYLRFTITYNSGGDVRLSSIRGLTSRWGDQGQGRELSFPYDWDSSMNMTVRGTTLKVGSNEVIHSGNFNTTTLNGHVGSGGSAHAVAISGGANGFIDGVNYGKLLRIQDNSINQTTADGRYLTLTGGNLTGTLNTKDVYTSGNINVTGNIVITGTVDGVDVSNLNSSFATVSGNFTNHVGSGGSAHALVNATTNGFMSYQDFNKLATVAQSANNYVHPTGDGNLHVPANGTSHANQVLKASATAGTYSWASVDWSELINKPSTFTPSAHTHTVSNITDISTYYYTKTEVDNAVSNAGDIKAGQDNVFHNVNTFDNAGLGIKIQPSASVGNTTKLLQINNTTGGEVFSVNYSGGVAIAGDFTVTGVQTFSGTTTVNGDYTVNGQLIVGGNSALGDSSTDVTTVNGTLKVQNGSIQEIGKYSEVHRRPIYGIAGDLQFQTDSTVLEDITDYYDLSSYALPTVKSGATRYYQLYVIYSDDITSVQQTAGQKATIRIAGSTNKDLDLPITTGAVNGRRDWFSGYFTDLPTGNGKIQAKLATTGNNLGIRWVELVAYDKF